jgi:hypothetical protein
MTKLYYSEKVAPYVLKKESTATDAAGSATLLETVEAVVALEMPQKLKDDIVTTSHIKTVRRSGKGTIVTLEVHSPKVPGGVVSHTSKELDANGHVVRRSTLELVDYGEEDDHRFLTRRQQKRASKGRRG